MMSKNKIFIAAFLGFLGLAMEGLAMEGGHSGGELSIFVVDSKSNRKNISLTTGGPGAITLEEMKNRIVEAFGPIGVPRILFNSSFVNGEEDWQRILPKLRDVNSLRVVWTEKKVEAAHVRVSAVGVAPEFVNEYPERGKK